MIYITDELQQQIKAEGEKYYPNECCGILLGKLEKMGTDGQNVKRISSILPVNNSFSDEEQYHRFLITSEMMMQAELEARKHKQDIVGFYHSHPNNPAFPSEYDRIHALPVYSYIITSVVFEIAIKMNSFELSAEERIFYPEDIVTI